MNKTKQETQTGNNTNPNQGEKLDQVFSISGHMLPRIWYPYLTSVYGDTLISSAASAYGEGR